MKRKPLLILVSAGVLLLLLVVLWIWIGRRPSAGVAIDLIETFPDAEKRTNNPSLEAAFALKEITIQGDTKRCIYAHPYARIIWSVMVPEGATLETSFGVEPETWGKPGADGVQFRIGVSDGETYTELVKEYVDTRLESQRRWFTSRLDLSWYAGRTVKIIFNTDPGPDGGWNTTYDWAVWGEPRIIREHTDDEGSASKVGAGVRFRDTVPASASGLRYAAGESLQRFGVGPTGSGTRVQAKARL